MESKFNATSINCRNNWYRIKPLSGINSEKYKIIKIDSLQNTYIIYAKKQDSTFKIVSKKNASDNCIIIKINEYYNLKIKSLFPVDYYQKIQISAIKFKLEGNGIVWDLFISENLNGLCYVAN